MKMTVGELIEMLEEQDEEAEVKLMTQPSWPFEYTIAGITSSREILRAQADEMDGEAADEAEAAGEEEGEVIYLLEGTQLGYGSREAWNQV